MKRLMMTIQVCPDAYLRSREYRELLARLIDISQGLSEMTEDDDDEKREGYKKWIEVMKYQIKSIESFWMSDEASGGYYYLSRFLEDAVFEMPEAVPENDVFFKHVSDTRATIVLWKEAFGNDRMKELEKSLKKFLKKVKGDGWMLVFSEPESSKTYNGHVNVEVELVKKDKNNESGN